MSTVYCIHQPVRYDKGQRRMVPLDIEPASGFGTVKVIFPGHNRPPNMVESGGVLKAAMARFTAEDYLLIAGDMDLIAFAAVLAAKATGGKLKLLKWDKRNWRYYEMSAPDGLLA